MTKQIKAFLQGIGSVTQISPPARVSPFAHHGTDAERLRADFERIGQDMRQVFAERTANGQSADDHQNPA